MLRVRLLPPRALRVDHGPASLGGIECIIAPETLYTCLSERNLCAMKGTRQSVVVFFSRYGQALGLGE